MSVAARLGIAAALAAGSMPVAAQDPKQTYRPSADYERCMRQGDAVRGNAIALNVCLGVEQAAQQERMANAFDRAFDALTGWDQVRLYNEQTEWRAALDERCAEQVRRPGQVNTDSRAFNVCLTLEYAARVAWLDDYEPE